MTSYTENRSQITISPTLIVLRGSKEQDRVKVDCDQGESSIIGSVKAGEQGDKTWP